MITVHLDWPKLNRLIPLFPTIKAQEDLDLKLQKIGPEVIYKTVINEGTLAIDTVYGRLIIYPNEVLIIDTGLGS